MKTFALVAILGAGLTMVGRSQSPPRLEGSSGDVVVALGSVRSTSPSAAPAPRVSEATLSEVVQQYCVACHNDALLTGNLTLQGFDVALADERAETAERMIRKLRTGMMPPPGMPRPGGDTLLALVETLEAVVDDAARARPELGTRRFTRLTRAEYERVIYDLLGVEVDASRWLPPDVLVGAFDNTAAAQALSTTLLDSFLRAAGEVSRMAVGEAGAVSVSTRYQNPVQVSQHAWDHVEGTPFGTRGGMVATHTFPADGEYVFQVETDLGGGNQTSMEDIDISIDGEPVARLMLPHNGADTRRGFGGGDNSGAAASLQTEPVFVTAGQHQVSAAFVKLIEGPYEDRFQPTAWSWAGTQGSDYGVTGLAHLTGLIVTGPQTAAGVSETPSRQKVFTCYPASEAEQRPCARSIVERLAGMAYRRAATEDEITHLLTLYDEIRAEEGFEIGVRTALQGILASPQFVFRLERVPEGTGPGESYLLSDIDLATRLAFFLWATTPDQELLDLAERGRLANPDVLKAQVARMLDDPRSEALAKRFFHQWLRLQDVGKVWPERYLFPDFSNQIRDDMVRESEMLFQHLVRENRSVLELFRADYSFLNERLAEHYGIEGIQGDEMRLISYPDDRRRGIFGHGSVLQLTSMSDRTSPVLRGKWVMEVLMGTPPPPPPPNVPAFDASPPAAAGRRLTTRERMERHRNNPVCSSCHNFIDPIGLALDNFDVTGKWRVRENMAPLDTRGQFYDGTTVSRPAELSQVLLKRPIPLVRNFTNHLLSYALGRPTEYHDQPWVREISRAAEPGEYQVRSLIEGVVLSDPFRMRQTQPTTADGEGS